MIRPLATAAALPALLVQATIAAASHAAPETSFTTTQATIATASFAAPETPLAAPPAPAAQPAPGAQPATDGEQLTVYLMTMGPGDAVWERFGHNALWIHDPVAGTDYAYNYGLFSFEQPGFIRRFLLGRMLYSMAPGDAHLTVRAYAQYNRAVWVQELYLTPAQKAELQAFLEWNALPENRDYLYDYYRDNCSTRLRDALDRVMRGELRTALTRLPTAETYRSHSLRLTHDDVPVFTGLLLAMGTPVDRPLTAWEESFIPMELSAHLQRVAVPDGDGGTRPLASEPRLLFSADRAPTPESVPRRHGGYLVISLLFSALVLALGHQARRAPRPVRVTYASLLVVWSVLVGVFGTVIALLWAVTDHYVTAGNANVLLANPLGLVLAVTVPPALARGGAWARITLWAALLAAFLALVAVVIALLPVHGQRTGEMLALLVAPHLAVAYSLWRLLGSSLSSAEDART